MATAASHHPHLLLCATHGNVRLPVLGQAIFAQSVPDDTANRLVYAPLGTESNAFGAITLPQYVSKADEDGSLIADITRLIYTPHELDDVVGTRDGIMAKLAGLCSRPDCPAEFKPVLTSMLSRGKEGLQSLLLGKLRFIGIMLLDNLSERDRRWWARRGQLQVTTCVEGLATVRFDPEKNEVLAMDHFVPLTPAVWDIQTNALVRYTRTFDSNRHVVIGIIISTGVREVNILTNVAHAITGT
tara:strand:+ start:421 stop:1149 length:729 start_codon:yes stop_codon:yes gene_type:complete